MGLLYAILDERQATIGASVLFGLVGLALSVWQAVCDEHRLALGAGRVRYVERQTWFGVARPETVVVDVPLDESSRGTQVNTCTPTSRGGWNHASELVFSGDHRVSDDVLGSREDRRRRAARSARPRGTTSPGRASWTSHGAWSAGPSPRQRRPT